MEATRAPMAAVGSSIEGERLLRAAAEDSIEHHHALAADLEEEMSAVRHQFEALRREADGGMPLSMALPRIDHSLEAPLRAPALSSSPLPAARRRSGRGGLPPSQQALDHSLAAPAGWPTGAVASLSQQALDHSLAAPARWPTGLVAPTGGSSPRFGGSSPTFGEMQQRRHVRGEGGRSGRVSLSLDHGGFGVPPADFGVRQNAGGHWQPSPRGGAVKTNLAAEPEPEPELGPLLDLVVVVVDETFSSPPLHDAPPYHGRVHDLRNLSPDLQGAELVARCIEGVPVLSRFGCRWCLCWGEAEDGSELGRPGPRIEVIEEAGRGGGGPEEEGHSAELEETPPRLLHDWTLAEAGVEQDDVLWCRYLMLPLGG